MLLFDGGESFLSFKIPKMFVRNVTVKGERNGYKAKNGLYSISHESEVLTRTKLESLQIARQSAKHLRTLLSVYQN